MATASKEHALRAPRSMSVRSPHFREGGPIPREFSGHGDDVSPTLELTGIPPQARSLAIIVDDPDAPRGTWTHWTAWNFAPGTTRIERGMKGPVEGRTSAGTTGYHGPAPPSGTHRYFFRVFALDGMLDLKANASIEDVWKEVGAHAIAWGETMGTFART